jgi:hypothetical protein
MSGETGWGSGWSVVLLGGAEVMASLGSVWASSVLDTKKGDHPVAPRCVASSVDRALRPTGSGSRRTGEGCGEDARLDSRDPACGCYSGRGLEGAPHRAAG